MRGGFGFQLCQGGGDFICRVLGCDFKGAARQVQAQFQGLVDAFGGYATFGQKPCGLVREGGFDAQGYGCCVGGRGAGLGGEQEALARFAPKVACSDLGFERVEDMVAWMAQGGLQPLGGGEVDVGPDQVNQRQGADFVASGEHGCVDVAGAVALFQQG